MRHLSKAPEEPIFLRPLIPLSLAFLTGIGFGVNLPGFFGMVLIAVLIMAVGIFGGIKTRHPMLVPPLLLFVGIGYLSIQPWLKLDGPSNDIRHFINQGKCQVHGIVVEVPETSGRNVQFDLEGRQVTQGQQQVNTRGKIRVTARGDVPDLHRGDRVTVAGHLREIRGFCNPGGFDYEHYMALEGVHARLFTQAVHIQAKSDAKTLPIWVDIFRRQLDGQISTALGNHPAASCQVLKALTLGRRDAISEDLRDAFSRAGVSHVLAISGLHIGMVATVAFAFFCRLLVWVPWLLHRAWVSRGAALLSLLPVFGYGLLAGLSPSTQRAMIMVAALLMTYWIGRRNDWFNILAVAALIILVVSPPALVSVSFQLSFAAVLTILLGLRALPVIQSEDATTRWHRWARRLWAFVSVSILATAGTAPLVMYYFNQVSWIGPLTNLVVVPLAGFWVVPAGLLGIAVLPLSSVLADFFWQVAGWGADAMVWFILHIDTLPHIAFTTVTPTVLEIFLCYLLLAVWFFRKRRVLCLVGLAILFVAAGLDTVYWVHRRFDPDRMRVTAVDVGQGSANLLQLPGGFTVLLDGGGFGDNKAFDVGRSVLAPLLLRKKIQTIDLIILSHPNSDHLNGLLFILDRFKVGRVWSNHEPEDSYGYRQWRRLIAKRRIPHESFDRVPRWTTLGKAVLELLGPPDDFLARRQSEPWRDLNNNSMVVRVSWGDVSFLFTGDVLAESEAELVARHGSQKLHSTILFVPHHGSRSSSTQVFVDAVRPKEGIISAGWRNRFRFPHPTVLKRLEESGCRIWRTDRCGAVEVTTNGKDYSIQTCRAGDGGT